MRKSWLNDIQVEKNTKTEETIVATLLWSCGDNWNVYLFFKDRSLNLVERNYENDYSSDAMKNAYLDPQNVQHKG